MNERSGICRALSIKPRRRGNCIGWIARRAECRRRRCRSCPASRPTANGLRTRWGSPVRAPRQLRHLLRLHSARRAIHPIQFHHHRGLILKARQIPDLPFIHLVHLVHPSSAARTGHAAIPPLAPDPQLELLVLFVDLLLIDPIARESQHLRQVVLHDQPSLVATLLPPLWFGKERKKETLDEYFRTELTSRQRKGIEAVCVDMWEPFRLSLEQRVPGGKIIYDKFHVLGHANDAVDEVRKAEFFRQGREKRELIKGKKWLLLSRWKNLNGEHRGDLNELFRMNRRVFKAYLLKESLEGLWDYKYPGAMLNYLGRWMDRLKWQRLAPFEELADMLLKHLEGTVNYCRTKVRFGVVEAVNGNIRMLINRGRGYKNLRYLLLKAKRMAVTNVEFLAVQRVKKVA